MSNFAGRTQWILKSLIPDALDRSLNAQFSVSSPLTWRTRSWRATVMPSTAILAEAATVDAPARRSCGFAPPTRRVPAISTSPRLSSTSNSALRAAISNRACTTSATGEDALGRKRASPAYVALIECEPTDRPEVVKVAWLEACLHHDLAAREGAGARRKVPVAAVSDRDGVRTNRQSRNDGHRGTASIECNWRPEVHAVDRELHRLGGRSHSGRDDLDRGSQRHWLSEHRWIGARDESRRRLGLVDDLAAGKNALARREASSGCI